MAQDAAADYRRGDMDVQDHLATYERFGALYKWGSLVAADLVLFLSLLFCAHAGFFASAAVGIIVLGAGVWWLTRKKPDEAEVELSGR